MNKLLVTLLIGIMSTQISSAQVIKSYGIKAAFTSANQTFESGSGTRHFSRRSGLNGAVFAEWLSSPYFSIITQVEYAQRGMRDALPSTTQGIPVPLRLVTVDNRLDYVSIPVLFKVTLPLRVLKPYIVAGPRLDLFLGYKSDDYFYPYGNGNYEFLKKSSYGASLGLGLELTNVLPIVLSIEGRYNADLVNTYSSSSMDIRNDAFDIWLGVAF